MERSDHVGARIDSLDRLGALGFAHGLCAKHHLELDEVLDVRLQGTSVRRARRELLVVVTHTLGLDYSEAARAFMVTRSTVQHAERKRLRHLEGYTSW